MDLSKSDEVFVLVLVGLGVVFVFMPLFFKNIPFDQQ